MRVLTFTSLFPNAAKPQHGIFIYQRMSHFARRGHTVEVMAPVPYFPSWLRCSKWCHFAAVPNHEQIGNLTVHHPAYVLVPRVSMPLHGWLMYLGSVHTVRRLHEQFHFDCIDAHYVYPDGFAAMLLGKALRLPVVVSARGTDLNLFPSFRLIRPMIRRTLETCNAGIGVSTALRKIMVELGLSATRAHAIGNGVDLERFSPIEPRDARRQLGLPQDAPIVISVGHLVAAKNHDMLIRAVAALIQVFPTLRLYVIGGGPLRASLQRLAKELGVNERVSLVGPKPNEELPSWYSAGDLSCLVSAREGWPNVVLESLACGTPVLATQVGAIPEIMVSPDLGIVVEADQPSITRGLELALRSKWDRNTIARRATRRSWDAVAAEVEAVLEQVARTGHPAGATTAD